MHYAARFAAKEAVAKALGTGFADGVGWSDIEVIRATNGQPSIQLHGSTADRAKSFGVKQIHLTLTHTKDTAAASVVIMG
jgi:holo-[acyl-carrier protein] synthase